MIEIYFSAISLNPTIYHVFNQIYLSHQCLEMIQDIKIILH